MAKLVPVIILPGSSEPTAGSGIIDGAAERPKSGTLPSRCYSARVGDLRPGGFEHCTEAASPSWRPDPPVGFVQRNGSPATRSFTLGELFLFDKERARPRASPFGFPTITAVNPFSARGRDELRISSIVNQGRSILALLRPQPHAACDRGRMIRRRSVRSPVRHECCGRRPAFRYRQRRSGNCPRCNQSPLRSRPNSSGSACRSGRSCRPRW